MLDKGVVDGESFCLDAGMLIIEDSARRASGTHRPRILLAAQQMFYLLYQ